MNDYEIRDLTGSSQKSNNQKISNNSGESAHFNGTSENVKTESDDDSTCSSSLNKLSNRHSEPMNHLSVGGFVAKDLLSSLTIPLPQTVIRTCQSIDIDTPDRSRNDKTLTSFFYSSCKNLLLTTIIPDPLDLVAAAVGQSTAQALLVAQVMLTFEIPINYIPFPFYVLSFFVSLYFSSPLEHVYNLRGFIFSKRHDNLLLHTVWLSIF